MTHISLAIHNSELIVISDMDTFARNYCYAKKQKQGQAVIDKDLVLPEAGEAEETTTPVIEYEIEEQATPDDDDI